MNRIAMFEGWDGWKLVKYISAGERMIRQEGPGVSLGYLSRYNARPAEARNAPDRFEIVAAQAMRLAGGECCEFVGVPLGAWLDVDTGRVLGAPDEQDAQLAGDFWRSIAAGSLAAIVAEARAAYVQARTFEGDDEEEARGEALDGAHASFLELFTFADCSSHNAALADVANATQFARAVGEALDEAREELRAVGAVTDAIAQATAAECETARQGFIYALGILYASRNAAGSASFVRHLCRHAIRLFDVYGEAFNTDGEYISVEVVSSALSSRVSYMGRHKEVYNVLCPCWYVTDGDKIARDKAVFNALDVATRICDFDICDKEGRFLLTDSSNVIFNRRPKNIFR